MMFLAINQDHCLLNNLLTKPKSNYLDLFNINNQNDDSNVNCFNKIKKY